mmetsp:Transcript_13318/g.32107  ORF Transcript_13318/g.32107 Transcript_13318/m.32107 type:complete len:207 (-) Transcript_13318:294-914(-)
MNMWVSDGTRRREAHRVEELWSGRGGESGATIEQQRRGFYFAHFLFLELMGMGVGGEAGNGPTDSLGRGKPESLLGHLQPTGSCTSGMEQGGEGQEGATHRARLTECCLTTFRGSAATSCLKRKQTAQRRERSGSSALKTSRTLIPLSATALLTYPCATRTATLQREGGGLHAHGVSLRISSRMDQRSRSRSIRGSASCASGSFGQ